MGDTQHKLSSLAARRKKLRTMKNITKIITTLMVILLIFSCSEKLQKTADDKFVGLWEIKGRTMFEGIQIEIVKDKNDFIGRITKLNDNKFIKLFADSNDVWVSGISRTSNFTFKLTEKKIAKDLFALYGQSTSQEFKVQFIDDNTIGLANDNSDPTTSKVTYNRVLK